MPATLLDPRLDRPSYYDRDAVVAAVGDFWEFLSTMPAYEKDDVLWPPPGGWPSITKEYLAPLGKNDTVVDLLKHLPYLNMDSQTYAFAPTTQPIDYRSQVCERALQNNFDRAPGCWYIPPYGPYPDWVIPLSTGIIRGEWALLDTTDGTITRQLNANASYEPSYAEGDPRKWRDECTDDTVPAAEYFRILKGYFERLQWQPHWWHGKFNLGGSFWDREKVLSDVYRKHGWPTNQFNREACKAELLKLDAERFKTE